MLTDIEKAHIKMAIETVAAIAKVRTVDGSEDRLAAMYELQDFTEGVLATVFANAYPEAE